MMRRSRLRGLSGRGLAKQVDTEAIGVAEIQMGRPGLAQDRNASDGPQPSSNVCLPVGQVPAVS
jgi:hypothetical protein